jgi:energy-coupling factor transporter ATP-binding protein EcfA2
MKPVTNLAFLVAVKDYQHVGSLSTPLNDIQVFGELLRDDYDYTVIPCENPTLESLRAFFKQMEEVTKEAEKQLSDKEPLSVLFHFAGHGVAKDSDSGINGFLIPADGQRNNPSTWLPMEKLLMALEALSCKHSLVLLDCCFSGSLRWASKHRDISGFLTSEEKLYKQHYEHFRSRPSSQVLTSSAPDQLALDFVRSGRATKISPFIECVIQGLKGDADTVPDKIITCGELFSYLQSHLLVVSERNGNPQNASLFPLNKHDFGEYLFFMDGFDPADLEIREYHNPYQGLNAYEVGDRKDFYGRSKAIAELWRIVQTNSVTVVLGASGTGKSSLVKAGIVPKLEGMGQRVEIIKPGLIPLAELPDDTQTFDVLVIDQLEQLVTLASEKEAESFLSEVYKLLDAGKKVIATLRIDYESRMPKVFFLKDRWYRYLVPPFSAEELREVIVTPAFRHGHFITPMSLVDRIIEEVIHYPGSLPLLSFTMRQLFERCKDQPFGNITQKDYDELGGVIGSLQRKADSVYNTLPDDAHRNTMRCLMLRMVALTGGQIASKRILLKDLDFNEDVEKARLDTVRELLEQERLVVVGTDHSGQEYMEPVHDALVNTWDKVQQWVKSIGDANLLLHVELEAAVDKYRREGMRPSHLWHNNPSLQQANLLEGQFLLTKQERAYLLKSRRKRRGNSVRVWTIVALVMAGLSGLGLFANQQRLNTLEALEALQVETDEKERQTELAKSNELEAKREAERAEKERAQAEAEQKRAEEALVAKRREEEEKNKLQFGEILRNADRLFKARQFRFAKEEYEKALPLAPTLKQAEEVQSKINQCNETQ